MEDVKCEKSTSAQQRDCIEACVVYACSRDYFWRVGIDFSESSDSASCGRVQIRKACAIGRHHTHTPRNHQGKVLLWT